MSRPRNILLSFSEWELINEELSDQEYHPFKLSEKQLVQWKENIKLYPSIYEERVFNREDIYWVFELLKSSKAINILCRKEWRSQDITYMMRTPYAFIGFILTWGEDVNMDTSLAEWNDIRNRMNEVIKPAGERFWFTDQLIELYNRVVEDKCSADRVCLV